MEADCGNLRMKGWPEAWVSGREGGEASQLRNDTHAWRELERVARGSGEGAQPRGDSDGGPPPCAPFNSQNGLSLVATEPWPAVKSWVANQMPSLQSWRVSGGPFRQCRPPAVTPSLAPAPTCARPRSGGGGGLAAAAAAAAVSTTAVRSRHDSLYALADPVRLPRYADVGDGGDGGGAAAAGGGERLQEGCGRRCPRLPPPVLSAVTPRRR